MDLLAMRPSEWRDLSQTEITDDIVQDIVLSLKSLLFKVQYDDDHGAEEAYETGLELADAGLWPHLSKTALADALWPVEPETIEALLSVAPREVAEFVTSEINRRRNVERAEGREDTDSFQLERRGGVKKGAA